MEKTKTILFFIIAALALLVSAKFAGAEEGAIFWAVQSGDWNNSSTWEITEGNDADGIPDGGDEFHTWIYDIELPTYYSAPYKKGYIDGSCYIGSGRIYMNHWTNLVGSVGSELYVGVGTTSMGWLYQRSYSYIQADYMELGGTVSSVGSWDLKGEAQVEYILINEKGKLDIDGGELTVSPNGWDCYNPTTGLTGRNSGSLIFE